eukprot:scaffold18914_cov107-Isochrysis_galbana.AAC.2
MLCLHITKSQHDARPAHTADKREKTRRGAPGPRNRALPAWPHPPRHSSTACAKAATLLGSANCAQ